MIKLFTFLFVFCVLYTVTATLLFGSFILLNVDVPDVFKMILILAIINISFVMAAGAVSGQEGGQK